MKLLHIDSSITGSHSVSRTVTREIVGRWIESFPGVEVAYRDLAADSLPHLNPGTLAHADAAEAVRDSEVLEEFLSADVIVVGAPMYNFTIPTQLKAWIDRITVAGKTFRYTDAGPQGLAGGKRVIVAIARGGQYAPGTVGEHAESYLRYVFGFLGITDLTFVRAEGLAISAERRQKALSDALAGIPTPVLPAAARAAA